MGGAPYQSSGCSNCRKRRIKCDLGKPECSKCIKKGVPCPGYLENRNILHHKLVSRRTQHGEISRPVPHLQGVEKRESFLSQARINTSAEIRTQIFSGFMNTLFAHNTLLEGKDDSWYLLMAQFPRMAGESGLVDRSVISLAATFLAKKTDNTQLIRHGVEIYNSAIAGLARMLKRNCRPTLEMFYAMIIFHTYELMQTGGDVMHNCFVHVQGATAILKHLDYTDHEERPFLRAMLIRQKWAATYFVLNKKFRSQVNWECFAICAEESPLDQLFAILAESALLQISLDQIQAQRPLDTERSCTALLRRCLETEKKLQDWISECASKLDGRPAPTKNIMKYDPNTIPLGYAVAPYEFPSLQTAKTYILFWLSLLVVRRVYYRTKNILGEPSDSTHMLFCAGEVCNSVAYCMQSGRRISAAQVILFGVSQAAQCYIDCGDKERFIWCQEMYPMGKSSGFTYVDCLKQEEYESWNQKHSQFRIPY